MHDVSRKDPAHAACPLESSTGPAAEANTGAVNCGFDPAGGECSAELKVRVTHNRVVITAVLEMGGRNLAEQVWERLDGKERGWRRRTGTDFIEVQEWISTELAEFAEDLRFPFALADMLPGRKASAAAVADAAQEVARA